MAVVLAVPPELFFTPQTQTQLLWSELAAPLSSTCATWVSTSTAPAPWSSPGGPAVPGQGLLLHNPPSHTEQREGSKCMQHFIEKIRMFCT